MQVETEKALEKIKEERKKWKQVVWEWKSEIKKKI